jgi:type IV secretion system protein VirD4
LLFVRGPSLIGGRMSANKILWGQMAVTQWTAWKLGFQSGLGPAWFHLLGWPIYQPPAFFWWWFAYDAYARQVFVEGAYIAAFGGVAAVMRPRAAEPAFQARASQHDS